MDPQLARAIFNALSSPCLTRALDARPPMAGSQKDARSTSELTPRDFHRTTSTSSSDDASPPPESVNSPGLDAGKAKKAPRSRGSGICDSANSLGSMSMASLSTALSLSPSSSSPLPYWSGSTKVAAAAQPLQIKSLGAKPNMLPGVTIAQADIDAAKTILSLSEPKYDSPAALLQHLLGFSTVDSEDFATVVSESSCSSCMFLSAYLHNLRQLSSQSSSSAVPPAPSADLAAGPAELALQVGSLDPKYQALISHMLKAALCGPSAAPAFQDAGGAGNGSGSAPGHQSQKAARHGQRAQRQPRTSQGGSGGMRCGPIQAAGFLTRAVAGDSGSGLAPDIEALLLNGSSLAGWHQADSSGGHWQQQQQQGAGWQGGPDFGQSSQLASQLAASGLLSCPDQYQSCLEQQYQRQQQFQQQQLQAMAQWQQQQAQQCGWANPGQELASRLYIPPSTLPHIQRALF